MYCLAYHTVFDFKCLVNKMGVYKDDKRVNARIFFFSHFTFQFRRALRGLTAGLSALKKNTWLQLTKPDNRESQSGRKKDGRVAGGKRKTEHQAH